MKKKYMKPLLNSEEFVPQEYVAACWIVSCDVESGTGYYETNGVSGCQIKEKENRYEADKKVLPNEKRELEGCNAKHKGVQSPSRPEFNCYWVTDEDDLPTSYNCFHWYQDVGHDLPDHFSTLTWAPITNPNAS